MVKKNRYDIDKLIKESEKRVLNEHELIFILGKILLSEHSYNSDEEINNRSKWNPKRWMWMFQRMIDNKTSRNNELNNPGENSAIYKLDQIAATNPEYALRILNTPNHILTKGLSSFLKRNLRSKYSIMFRDKREKDYETNRDSVVGITPTSRDIQIKQTGNSRVPFSITKLFNMSGKNKKLLPDDSDRHASIIQYPDDSKKILRVAPHGGQITSRFSGKAQDLIDRGFGTFSENDDTFAAYKKPSTQKIHTPDVQWVTNLIKANNLTPGDILSGNKLDLRNPSHLNLVNYYRQSKNMKPITSSGQYQMTQDELSRNSGKYAIMSDIRRGDREANIARDNLKDMQNWGKEILDPAKVDFATQSRGGFWRNLGNKILGRKQDPNRPFTAISGDQSELDSTVAKIKKTMEDLGIQGVSQGTITNDQVYNFMDDAQRVVLNTADGTPITKLQLMYFVKSGQMDQRTYNDIITEFNKTNLPVSLAKDKVPEMDKVWDPKTREYHWVPKKDKKGNQIYRTATEEDIKNHRNQYVGNFSALNQQWQDRLRKFVNPSSVKSTFDGRTVDEKGNISYNNVYNAPGYTHTSGKRKGRIVTGGAATTGLTDDNGRAIYRINGLVKNNPFVSVIVNVLRKHNLPLDTAIINKIVNNNDTLKNQLNSPNYVMPETEILSQYNRLANIHRTNGGFAAFDQQIGPTARYSENFIPEIFKLVFIEEFTKYLLNINHSQLLKEGNGTSASNNVVDIAFQNVNADSEQIPQDQDYPDEEANDSENENPLAQATGDNTANASDTSGNLVGRALNYIGTGISNWKSDHDIKKARLGDTNLYGLIQYALYNPYAPIDDKVADYLTSGEVAKIKSMRGAWLDKYPNRQPLWAGDPLDPNGTRPTAIPQDVAQTDTQTQGVAQSSTDLTNDEVTDTSKPNRYAPNHKEFDPDNVTTWGVLDNNKNVQFSPQAEKHIISLYGGNPKKSLSKQPEFIKIKAAEIQKQIKDYYNKKQTRKSIGKMTNAQTFTPQNFQQLFAALNRQINGKFQYDPSTNSILTNPANGSKPQKVLSASDNGIKSITLGTVTKYDNSGNLINVPMIDVNYDKNSGRRKPKKRYDLSRYSEASSDVLSYNQFIHRFKESIQKHSSEISSKNMYQLYLLGKLKKLL